MNHRRLSVLLPAFNAGETIGRAIDSVLANTFRDFELIVIDDGSTDRTAEMVQSINDPRIRLIQTEHQGLVATLNFGLRKCGAPLIARMDADDLCRPDRFQLQLDCLRKTGADIVGGRVRIVTKNGAPVNSWRRYESWINDHLDSRSIRGLRFVESPLVHPTVMARKEVFQLGYRDGDFPEDYDLWLRAFAAGFEAVKVPEVVLDWVDGPKRLTRSHSRYSNDAFNRCRREHLLNGPLNGVGEVDLWGAGQTGKPWLRWLRGENITVRKLIDVDPGKIGQTIHGATVIAPEHMPASDGTPLVAAVGAKGAREQIAAHMEDLGYTIGADVWFVA